MDGRAQALRKEREKARVMKEGLKADQAKLKAKERERAMRLKHKDRALALKAFGEILAANFLDSNWDDQQALTATIEAFLKVSGAAGGGNKAGAFHAAAAAYGEAIDYLSEVKAMTVAGVGGGRSNDGNDSSTASGGGCSGGYSSSDDEDEEY